METVRERWRLLYLWRAGPGEKFVGNGAPEHVQNALTRPLPRHLCELDSVADH